MDDSTTHTDTIGDGTDSTRTGDTGTPRWVKTFAAVAVALVLLYVLLHLTGLAPTGHGP